MNFIVLLIALAVERWTTFARQMRAYAVLQKYVDFMFAIAKRFSVPGWCQWLIFMLPITIIIGFIYAVLSEMIFGLLGIAFAVFVLFYCFGALPNENEPGDVSSMFVAVNRNIFAVIFWFAIFGPVGAVFYRVNGLLLSLDQSESLRQWTETVQTVLDWIPVRLECLTYAFTTHFKAVLGVFMKRWLAGLNENEQVLTEIGAVALSANAENVWPEAINLIDRSLVIWLVVIALVIIL